MKYYLEKTDDVIKHVESCGNGLSAVEAQKRLERDGKNKLVEAKKDSLIKKFFSQLADPMIIILIVAAVISAVMAFSSGDKGGFTDVIIISAVVLINAVLGVYQESKAEKAIEALAEMTAATSKVIRDGVLLHIKSDELVVGDIIVLEAGDSVPADARIIECAGMKVEEAALTGESVPVNKVIEPLNENKNGDVPLGDRKNMVYMGSSVVYGRGKAVVTDIGMNTEMGKIADALSKAEGGKTPLQIKLGELSKILTYLVVGICAFIFLFTMITTKDFFSSGSEKILDTFMVAVSLAVAAIPEGLATVVTIVLSMGVTKMSKRQAVIRKLTAVETLGCTQIICSDKTGTLTQNKMTVVKSFTKDEKMLAYAMALCSDAELNADNTVTGEPTEAALVSYSNTLGINKNKIKNELPRIAEVPFDSTRKMMTTVHNANGKIVQFTKGAPDEILKICTKYYDGKDVDLTDETRKSVLAANKNMADDALRVLACAYRVLEQTPTEETSEALEHDLTFIGLCGMIDPVRPEVKEAIEHCRTAGIRPIMITGDHINTAVAIAKELGIISDSSCAISGSDINSMTDEEFESQIEKYSVYARVQPEHKVKIVNAWKNKGYITAMTGDGVNDAPSIKSADIGVGMGITGTDVTKNVADMVLADDNFATIVSAVEEGRRIYDNIKKSIQFLLSSNLSEVFSIFAATIMGFTLLKPVHLLWINLITDCFPALALGTEKAENDIMQRKPRATSEGIFADGMAFNVIYQGVVVTLLTLAAFFIGFTMEMGDALTASNFFEMLKSESELASGAKAYATTMAFLTMSMAEIFHSFNMRSIKGSIFKMNGHNKLLYGAMIFSLILTTCVIEIPVFANAFSFKEISILEYSIALCLAILIIPIVEIIKLIQRKISKK